MHAGRWCGNGCRRSPRTGPVRAGEGAVVRRTALRRPAPPRTRREGVLRGNLSPLDPARGLSPRLSAANGGQRMAPPGAPPAPVSPEYSDSGARPGPRAGAGLRARPHRGRHQAPQRRIFRAIRPPFNQRPGLRARRTTCGWLDSAAGFQLGRLTRLYQPAACTAGWTAQPAQPVAGDSATCGW